MKTKPREKPDYQPDEWDFRFGPVRVGTNQSLASLAEHWAETEAVLKDVVLKSLEAKRLPNSAVLAQFISVPPQRGTLPINLRVPAVVRSTEANWKEFVRGFAYTAHFAGVEAGFSFHNRATRHLDTPAGTIVVFTVEQEPPKEHPFDGANVVWVHMKDVTRELLPHLSEIEVPSVPPVEEGSPFCFVHMDEILKDARSRKAFEQRMRGKQTATVRVYPKVNLDDAERIRLREFIVETFGNDDGLVSFNAYLKHVAGSVSCGPAILALPKKVYFRDQQQNALMDNSGLTTLFRQGTRLEYSDLEHCFRIGHRLSTVFTSLYGVAHPIMESEARKRRQLRDLALEWAAHVLIGPVSNFIIWLRELKLEPTDPTAIDCAVAALGIAKRNAETVLAIAPLEESPDAHLSLAITDIAPLHKELLDSLAAEFRTCHDLDIRTIFMADEQCLAKINKALLGVVMAKLLRNAFEHILEHRLKRRGKVLPPTIDVAIHAPANGIVRVVISNPGPVPPTRVLERLNSPPALDRPPALEGAAMVSWKGPTHYGLGTQVAKWLLADKLHGHAEWRGEKGRVVCEIAIPST